MKCGLQQQQTNQVCCGSRSSSSAHGTLFKRGHLTPGGAHATTPAGPPRPRCEPTCQLNTRHFRIKLKIYGEVTIEVGLPWGLSAKNLPANAGDPGLLPGLGGSPGEGNGYSLQDSCLGNPKDRGAEWATCLARGR